MRHDKSFLGSISDRRWCWCTGVELAVAALAASTATSTGLAIANATSGGPDLPSASSIPNALDAEKGAKTAATEAQKRMRAAAALTGGRAGTILTGGGGLGSLPGSESKKLLGL